MPPHLRLTVSIIACLVGPALSGIVVGLGAYLLSALSSSTRLPSGSLQEGLIGVASFAILPVVFGTVPMLIIGLPIQAWMARRGVTGLMWHAGPAALAGGLLMVMMFNGSLILSSMTLALGALYGGLAGAFAWMIRRPDRDAKFDTPKAPAA